MLLQFQVLLSLITQTCMAFIRKDNGNVKGFVCFVLFEKRLAWVETASTQLWVSHSRRMVCRCVAYFVILSYVLIALPGDTLGLAFPEDFLFGAATSAYQVEGAWNVDGEWIINIFFRKCKWSVVEKDNIKHNYYCENACLEFHKT